MVKRPIHRWSDNSATPEMDILADEVIVTLYCKGDVVVRLLATPQDLEDLAYGHVICEGIGRIDSLHVEGNEIHVDGELVKRPTDDILTAACGACTSGEITTPSDYVENTQRLVGNLQSMLSEMKENQLLFQKTGGVHATAVFDETGKLLFLREDIGRHNAFDKAIGASRRNNHEAKILLLSGRVGWELIAKSVRANVEIVIAVGAISSAAESLARSSGITLVGFCSSERPAVVGDLSRIIDKA